MASREQILDAIFTAENRQGTNQYNYRYKENPNYYTASGYYQIVNGTWRRHAPEVGIDINKYPTAISNPSYAAQRAVAGHILDTEGIGPWANYNPAIRPLISAIDKGEKPYLHSGPRDDGSVPFTPRPAAVAAGPSLGQSDGFLQFTRPPSNLLAPPGPASPPPDNSGLIALGLLGKMSSNHTLQPVPYDPFSVSNPKSTFEASPISAPQLHPVPGGKAPAAVPMSPGSAASPTGGLDHLLGDTGTPQVRGRPKEAGSSSQYG